MKCFGCKRTSNKHGSELMGRAEILSDQKESLHWIALMITGNATSAEQSIVDAGGLTETDRYSFRDWLVRWGRSATARAAVNAVRSSIQATAKQYLDCTCSHRTHEPLSPTEAKTLRELDPHQVILTLDILARSVLVLYGLQRASLSECAILLNVPLQCVVDSYCRALQWYREFAAPAIRVKRPHRSGLFLVRYDSDGVPVWDQQSSTV